MKTTATVFIIIGMVVNGIFILPLIFGFYALSSLDRATCKEDLIAPSILTMLFCNILAGIFMFCIDEKDLECNKEDLLEKPTSNNYSNIDNSGVNSNVVANNPNMVDSNSNTTVIQGNEKDINIQQEAHTFLKSSAVRSQEETSRKIARLYQGGQEYLSIAEIAVGAINLESFRQCLDQQTYAKAFQLMNHYQTSPEFQQQTLMNLHTFIMCMCRIQGEFQDLIGKPISPQGFIME